MREKKTRSVLFTEASVISAVNSNEYAGNVHPDWSYGPAALGGFTTSIILKAIALHYQTTLSSYNQPDTIAIHVEFLRPTTVGKVTVAIQDTRLGKRSSTVHAVVLQSGKERVAAYATNINRNTFEGLSVPTEFKLNPPVPSIDFDAVLENRDPKWIRYDTPYKSEAMNKVLSTMIFVLEKDPSGGENIRQSWLACSNPKERWTTDMLSIACDMYIPPAENYFDSWTSSRGLAKRAIEMAQNGAQHKEWDIVRWYTTHSMSIDVKRSLPKDGVKWLFFRMRTDVIADGRCDVHGQILDEEGNLIALAQYVWFIQNAARAVRTRAQNEIKSKGSKI